MQLCTARNSNGLDWPRLYAGVDSCRLWPKVHVKAVRVGFYCGAGFQFQGDELIACMACGQAGFNAAAYSFGLR